VDDRDIGGARGWEWIKKGIPIRIEIGPRDIAKDALMMARRDRSPKEKQSLSKSVFLETIPSILDEIQQGLFDRALAFQKAYTRPIDDPSEFNAFFTPKNTDKPEIHGGFALSHWCGEAECEDRIKQDLTVTIRCIPFDALEETGKCICCGRPSRRRVVFAKAY
jgi:prolyl-tRNA synthetase